MQEQQHNCDSKSKLHPGSSQQDADAIGGKADFGVPENNVAERTYASRNTKLSDRGSAQARSGEEADGARVSGAGGINSGVGSSSGGDIDTDLVGLSRDGGKPMVPPKSESGQRIPRVEGSTVQLPDASTQSGQGSDATGTGNEGDASAGEISSDEASGSNDAG